MAERIYLDHSATAPTRPEAIEAIADALKVVGNASSVHADGRGARRRLEMARQQVGNLISARPQDIIFTSGASEATSTVFLTEAGRPRLISAIEHDCVRAASGTGATIVPVTVDGQVDLAALEAALAGLEAPLVAVMAVNNETGAIQPVEEIGRLVAASGGRFLVDAVQAAGRIPIDVAAWQADYVTLSAHKIGGPQGAGALWMRPGLEVTPLILGGGQERRRRAGTEAVALQVGFGAVAAIAHRDLGLQVDFAAWRDQMEARLRQSLPDLTIWASGGARVATISALGLPGLAAETQVMRLDLAGISVSAGSACSSGKVNPSPVLTAMGADPSAAAEAIRVSFGWNTRKAELDRFADAYHAMATSRSGVAA